MDISALGNNPFAMKKVGAVQGVNAFQPVTAVKKAGADGGNPFGGQYVGLGIKDGEVQTSAAQMGKQARPMRQIGIA